MKANDVYIDLDGDPIPLGKLDAEERRLVAQLRRRAAADPDWNAFDNYWTAALSAFYIPRGLSRKAVTQTIPWQIAQDPNRPDFRVVVMGCLVGPKHDELKRGEFGTRLSASLLQKSRP